MELDAALDFVRSRHQGVLITLKRDGRPQLSNIAYNLGDDGVVRISITNGRAKTANIRRDDRVSLHVTRDDFYAYVVLEGEAELAPVVTSPDDPTADELVAYYRGIAGEHPNWDEYRQAMVDDQRLVVRLRPTRAYGMLPVLTAPTAPVRRCTEAVVGPAHWDSRGWRSPRALMFLVATTR